MFGKYVIYLLLLIGSGAGVSILSKTLLELYDTQDLKLIPLSNPPPVRNDLARGIYDR
jgi:hypothetical protein